jgi:hypothetical protein
MPDFPKKIHLTFESLNAHRFLTGTAEDALQSVSKTRVATYELKEVKEGKLEPVFSTIVG